MPRLQGLAKKYSKTGKFVFIASNVQGLNKGAIESFMDKIGGDNISVYHQVRLSFAPCGRGIPHMVLMDHKGEVVGDGHIQDLEKQIKKLIDAAPEAGISNNMLGDLEVKHHASTVKRLIPGRALKSTLDQLLTKSKKTDAAGVEAKQIYDAAIKWGKENMEAAQKSIETKPSEAYATFEMLAKTFRGYDWAKAAPAEMKKIKLAHKSLPYFIMLVKRVKNDEKRDRLDAKKAKSLIYSVNDYIKKHKPSDGLEAEANALLKKLNEV